jgi:hypothetical protein
MGAARMVMLEFAAKTASGDSVKLTILDNILAGPEQVTFFTTKLKSASAADSGMIFPLLSLTAATTFPEIVIVIPVAGQFALASCFTLAVGMVPENMPKPATHCWSKQ